MAYTAGIAPSVGDTIQAATGVAFGANDDWLKGKGDADHDFDSSTGTGYHNGAPSAGLHLINTVGNCAATIWLHTNGKLYVKVATSTTTPPVPIDEDDGEEIQSSTITGSDPVTF